MADVATVEMNRRQFLINAGVAMGTAAPLAGLAGDSPPPGAEATSRGTLTSKTTWDEVRHQFDLAPGMIPMSSFFLASHPRPVRDAIAEHRQRLDENPFHYVEDNVARFETAVREAAAKYLDAQPDDFAMTDSTTMGLGLIYTGMKLRPNQEIVSDTHDHIATTLSLQYAAERTGATLRQVPLYDVPEQADFGSIVDTLARNIRPSTRLIALTFVHSGTGVKLPVRHIADAIAVANRDRAPEDRVLLSVDCVHALGLENITVADVGCDFLIAGCHKWLFGPRGTGLVWGNAAAWAASQPTIPTFDRMWRTGDMQKMPSAAWHTPGGFHSFEHRWALPEAFQFHGALGKQRIAARIHELNGRCKDALKQLRRVKVHTPRSDDLSGGIICFEVEGLSPDEVVARLREKNVIASTTPGFYVPTYARVAPSLLTSEDDVDATVRAIADL